MALLALFWAEADAWAAAPAVSWSRSLRDLGYSTDIRSEGLEGEIALDWPLPAGSQSGAVALTLTALTTAGFTAVLDILVNGHGIQSQALAPGQSRLALTLPVPPEALAEGRLRVQLRYAAAASASRCRDRRLGGVSLAVDAGSALALTLPAPRTPAEASAGLPALIRIAVPDGPLTAPEHAALLKAAAGLARAGHRLAPAAADDADVILSRTATAPTLRNGVLILPLGEAVPATGPAIAIADTAALPLALGSEGTVEARPEAVWRFALPPAPPGQIPSGLTLSVTRGADAPGIHHILHLMIGGALAASAELPPGQTEPVTLAIPSALIGFARSATLRFERVAASGCVDAAAPLPVRLAPDARLTLAPAPSRARQFSEIASAAARDGLSLYLPAEYFGDPGPSLPLLAALLKDYWRPGTPLDLHPARDAAPPDRPFILIAEIPPDGLIQPLRAGAVTIETRDKRPILGFTRAEGGFATLAQLGARSGIWIAPAAGQALPRRLALEHGDLALFDEAGVALWLNTAAPRGLTLRYADATGLGALIGKGWPYGTALLWCLVTLATLIILAGHAIRR